MLKLLFQCYISVFTDLLTIKNPDPWEGVTYVCPYKGRYYINSNQLIQNRSTRRESGIIFIMYVQSQIILKICLRNPDRTRKLCNISSYYPMSIRTPSKTSGYLPNKYVNKYRLLYDIFHITYQPETAILAQGPKARGLIWVEGWYSMWYEKCHIITYLSYNSMRLSSYVWELIVFRNGFNHVGWFGIWRNNVILYLRCYYMYWET
jgi:hypothetical protein